MRFVAIFRPDVNAPPTQQEIEVMEKFIREAVSAGVLLATEGFGPSTKDDTLLVQRKGKFTVTDGPFAESYDLSPIEMALKK
jgi:hypothetical protein